MYSPGRLAFGSSFPSTAHSISRATSSSSMMIFRSYSAARSIASLNDFLSFARDTPTDDPKFAGLTKHGKPISLVTLRITLAGSLRHWDLRNHTCLHIGSPACTKSDFIVTLSMPHADASTPQPT